MMASRTAASALLLLLFLFSNCIAGSDSDATASVALSASSSGHNAGRRRTVVAEISKPVQRGGSGRSPARGSSSSARGRGGSLGQPSARGVGSVAAARRDHRGNGAGCATNHFHGHFAVTFLFSWLLQLLLLLW